jgi:SAM-dependent methyltransferase
MGSIADKNRASWDAYADKYAARLYASPELERLARDPASAFHRATWALIREAVPDLSGKRVLVPSSGDNMAVFAFALMGAHVTSADISQRQLENAEKAAWALGLRGIRFVRADTMKLEGIESGAYDLAYTSNGVHVWIDDLDGMYQNIARALKPGGKYALHEIHPFNRPFDDGARIIKPYDATGPFEKGSDVTFHWRLMDILGALLRAGLNLRRFEEMFAEKSYTDPAWVPCEKQVRDGYREYDHAEVDALYDWRRNPMAALPQWFSLLAEK